MAEPKSIGQEALDADAAHVAGLDLAAIEARAVLAAQPYAGATDEEKSARWTLIMKDVPALLAALAQMKRWRDRQAACHRAAIDRQVIAEEERDTARTELAALRAAQPDRRALLRAAVEALTAMGNAAEQFYRGHGETILEFARCGFLSSATILYALGAVSHCAARTGIDSGAAARALAALLLATEVQP